jgi:uncharacterized OsmC-like protein
VDKDFTIRIDEPLEIGGTNQYANPQEYLLAAVNACMMVGYVAVSSLLGVDLESVRIETEGDIDLRGFLGVDKNVAPGYESLKQTVYIKGNGTPEQFQKIHEMAWATSPNRYNINAAASSSPPSSTMSQLLRAPVPGCVRIRTRLDRLGCDD